MPPRENEPPGGPLAPRGCQLARLSRRHRARDRLGGRLMAVFLAAGLGFAGLGVAGVAALEVITGIAETYPETSTPQSAQISVPSNK